MKRILDVVVSICGLAVGSVVLLPAAMAVWMQDWRSPLYLPLRAGLRGEPYRMVKLRSMTVLADRSGVTSTAADDPRISRVGRLVRRWKLDELTQLWNVFRGEMSLVGPRPQVLSNLAFYTDEERQLLTVRPGITDPASVVFADEGDILRGSKDPDLEYNQLIRPWKSRLALLYVRQRPGIATDLRIIWLTALNVVDRRAALAGVSRLVRSLAGSEELARVALREEPLRRAPPPGATTIVEQAPRPPVR